eukprot:16245739-Heterocapsa_arctica.AAC.1
MGKQAKTKRGISPRARGSTSRPRRTTRPSRTGGTSKMTATMEGLGTKGTRAPSPAGTHRPSWNST